MSSYTLTARRQVTYIHTYTYSHILTHSLTHTLTHSLTHSLTHTLTYTLAHSLTRSFIHSLPHSLSPSVFLSHWTITGRRHSAIPPSQGKGHKLVFPLQCLGVFVHKCGS